MQEKNKMAQFIVISELESAVRQLETAIKLFLNDSDVVSIHILANGAHELLAKLAREQGFKSFIDDRIFKRIKPEKRKEWIEIYTKAKNFFKHGKDRKNKNGVIKFYHEGTDFILWDSCNLFQMINRETTPLIVVFKMWFYCKYFDTIEDEKIQKLYQNFASRLNFENRRQFLDLLPDIIKSMCRLS